jgi:hypothetical protein
VRVGRKLQIFAIQKCCEFFFSLFFCRSIVEILNFIAYVNGHGIFSGIVSMRSLLFFSGDYHFCILLSDSLSEFMQFSPSHVQF